MPAFTKLGVVFLMALALSLITDGALAADRTACCDASKGECRDHPHNYDGTKVALLFGVGAYSGKLSPLTNPPNDARDFAQILSDNGFSVRCLQNPKRKEAFSEIKRLASYVFEQDSRDNLFLDDTRVILYFAGHGFQLDSVDYFFFSSDKQLTGKAEIRDVSLSRREIFDEFAGLEKFEPHYIFDSCRKLFDFQLAESPGVVTRGSLPSENIDNPNPRSAVGGYYVVHATTKNGIALDSAPDNAANGAFMSGFKQEIGFPNLEFRRAIQFTVRRLQLQGLTSVPAQEGAGQFAQDMAVIRRSVDDCEALAANVWSETAFCRTLDKSCTSRKVCKVLQSAKATDLTCLKPMLEARLGYDPVQQCQQAAAMGGLFLRTETSEFASPALEASRNFAARLSELQATMQVDLAPMSETIARIDSKQPITQALQGKLRDALLPKGGGGSAVPAMTFDKNTVLQALPSTQGGTIRVLNPSTPLKLNCDTTACIGEWAAVTASLDNEIFRGWVRASQLVPALELRYGTEALYPAKSDLVAIKLKLKASPGASVGPVELTAVQAKGSTVLSESRLIRLKNYVVELGVPEDNIALEIKEVDRLDRDAFIEFKVAPKIPESLPLAYQPKSNVQ